MQLKNQWTLFKLFDIPVRLNLSVVLLAACLIYSFFDFSMPLFSVGIGLFILVFLLISILLHELAHSLTAIAFGGQVRDITLQLLGGRAAITRMPTKPWQEWLMAFAGPLCSFLIAAVAVFGATYFGGWGESSLSPEGEVVVVFYPNLWWSLVAMLNIGLGCFNLLPAFPMDGGRMLRSALQIFGKSKVRATEWAVFVGRCFAGLWVALVVLDFLFNIQVPCPSFFPPLGAYLWNIVFGSGGVIRLLIAYMIWKFGQRELEYVRVEAEYYGGWR